MLTGARARGAKVLKENTLTLAVPLLFVDGIILKRSLQFLLEICSPYERTHAHTHTRSTTRMHTYACARLCAFGHACGHTLARTLERTHARTPPSMPARSHAFVMTTTPTPMHACSSCRTRRDFDTLTLVSASTN